MAKIKTKFICNECGYETAKWMGRCPTCNEWNTFEEMIVEKANTKGLNKNREIKKAKKLEEVDAKGSERIVTSMNEFNRVLGGGIVKDSVIILTAKPGAGKSTLLLEVSGDLSNKGYKILYASGEESESQIKNRANRILKEKIDNIWLLSDTSMDNLLDSIDEVDPDIVIMDSIQTFSLEEHNSKPGSPVQTMECANMAVNVAKNKNRPRAIIMIGHMTKNNEMAGLRTLEHLVDTVLFLEGDNEEELRILTPKKNRFGRTGELGIFSMEEDGMVAIENPSEYFMTKRENDEIVAGSAISVIKEGTRSIIVEIESLVSTSFTPYPSRIGECLRKDQLNTLISILEQRGGSNLYDKNVVIKTTGGLKLNETSVNLAIIMSIVSSIKDKGIPSNTVFIGDVGLTGEIKKVPSIESRIKELERMGFKKVYVAYDSIKNNVKFKDIEVIKCKTLHEVINTIFEGRKTQ
ncbi:MAG: DNA repair protein RadA [Senegalia sp. (in: firmicutes)]|uniref:DNA repair protein RadA n=1 Tax=Senegalia sp. (in: firmicutes) TaxID=1924098 RepID=UPI003F94E607